jgi:hypothetical protein
MFAELMMVADIIGGHPSGRIHIQEQDTEERKAGLVEMAKKSLSLIVKAVEMHAQSPAVCHTG